MSVKLEWHGLNELREALKRLPEELTSEAATIVQAHAGEAQHAVQNAYPEGPTGNMKRGVVREDYRDRFTATSRVRSRSRHSHLFERGTNTRRTGHGANRGRMPEAPVSQQMIPIVIRKRRAMVAALKDLVRRAGFQVD